MQELWETKEKQYEQIKKQIMLQNEQINKQLRLFQEQLKELESNNNYQKSVYEKRMKEAMPQTQTKLEQAMEYNKNLFAIEMKNHICKIEELKNKLQINELYLTRVWSYLQYLKTVITGNSIDQITTYYQLLNVIQSEAIKKIQSEEEKYNNELDINSDYSSFLNICISSNYGNIGYLKSKLMDKEKQKEYEENRIDCNTKLENWKEIFRTQKIHLLNDTDQMNILMSYNMEKIIELFNIDEKKKIA